MMRMIIDAMLFILLVVLAYNKGGYIFVVMKIKIAMK
jgi:hypothetical protein